MATIADKFGRASIPTDVAIATTVKTTRTAGVLVLEAFDLSKFAQDTPVFFVTYKKTTDPVTGIVSVTNLVSWKALVNPGANTLTNLTVAPGYIDGGNAVGDFIECIPTSYWENSLIDGLFVGLNPDGTFKKSAIQAALGNDGNLVSSLDDLTSDVVISGGIWSLVSALNGQMTALTAYIDGYKNTVAAIASRAFTVSKDTYVDVLRNTTTNAFSIVYTEVNNGVAAPALAANSIRLAKIVSNGTTLTAFTQSGNSDGIGNIIRPAGSVSAAMLKNPIKFCVYRTSAHSWNNISSPNQYGADTKEYDVGNNYNTTTWTFTAPVTGWYDFSFLIQLNSQGGNFGVYPRLMINGVTYREYGQVMAASQNGGAAFNDINVPLKAGDAVTIFMGTTGAGASSVGGNNYSYWKGSLRTVD